MTKRETKAPVCPYCGQEAVLHGSSAKFYHGSDFGPVWACEDCQAWVGCHRGGNVPLGRLADKELREAKITAHAAFDRLWKAKMQRDKCSKGHARACGYKWLAAQLNIPPTECHVGMMDVERCRRVVEVCRPYLKAPR